MFSTPRRNTYRIFLYKYIFLQSSDILLLEDIPSSIKWSDQNWLIVITCWLTVNNARLVVPIANKTFADKMPKSGPTVHCSESSSYTLQSTEISEPNIFHQFPYTALLGMSHMSK